VALPEEMPVNETLDFELRLADEMGMAIDRAVVNALYPKRFTGGDAERLRAAQHEDGAARAALAEHERVRGQRSQLRRLRRGLDAPVATLPFLFEPELGVEHLHDLAGRLERAL
jgi:hypothetical protein